MNLLLTAIGKRVQLIEHLKSNFRVVGADASEQNAARHFVDSFYRVPGCKEEGYAEALLHICRKEEISLLIPLYEPEFSILNRAREDFEKEGVRLILSEEPVISICGDKRKTAAFFKKYGIPAPETLTEEEVRKLLKEDRENPAEYPLIIKPLDGMGSEGVFPIRNRKELEFFYDYVKNPMVQRLVSGTEYTVDVLCGRLGEPVYIVPRIRLEVRSGEVTKSRIHMQKLVIKETERLLAALRQEGKVTGPLTVQCFLSEDETKLWFIEVNPRFGGGVPLSFAAGADYASALKRMCQPSDNEKAGREKEAAYGTEIKELTMIRYEQAVYD